MDRGDHSRPLLPRSSLSPTALLQYGLPNRSFVYPLQGMAHLIAHRSLHPSLISRVAPLCLLSLFTVFFMFAFLWLPHVFVLSIFKDPFPKTTAATMILSEAAALVAIVAEAFLTEKQIVDVFDIVLLSATKRVRGLNRRTEALIKSCRELEMDESGDRRLGTHKVNPYQKFKVGLKMGIYFILELPLCLIPVVGTSMFLCLQGYHLGPLCHYRYFQLLDLDKATKKEFIRRNRWKYWLFGVVHVVLQLIPIISIFFLFSSGTGAALWAVEYEKRMWEEGGSRVYSQDDEYEAEHSIGPAVPKFGVHSTGGGQRSFLTWWRKD